MRALNGYSRWLGILFGTVAAFAFTACNRLDAVDLPDLVDAENNTITPSLALPTETPTLISGVSPTAPFVPAENQPDTSDQEINPPPTPAPDPLRFVFPDAPPDPVSAWRPPLYPIPWAPTAYDHFYFARPIAADEVNWPLADYRYGGVFFEGVVHTGVDIPASKGTPVIAAGDGKVVWAGWGLYRGVLGDYSDPYGRAIVIRHDFGYQGYRLYTVYGHLDRIDITRGQHVELGDQLGLVGDSGFVTGPHLHFEVRVGESDFFTTYNPELWIVPPQGWGLVAARILDTSGQVYRGEVVSIKSRDSGQVWKAIPYAEGPVNRDQYYRENLVVSDLPAGLYDVSINYGSGFYNLTFEIFPGRVTYFTFRGHNGFSLDSPPKPGGDFSPLD
jgi:murein DD-endopeptidase MepM/ murein hydrolase activator NlpD